MHCCKLVAVNVEPVLPANCAPSKRKYRATCPAGHTAPSGNGTVVVVVLVVVVVVVEVVVVDPQ